MELRKLATCYIRSQVDHFLPFFCAEGDGGAREGKKELSETTTEEIPTNGEAYMYVYLVEFNFSRR